MLSLIGVEFVRLAAQLTDSLGQSNFSEKETEKNKLVGILAMAPFIRPSPQNLN